MKFIIFNSVAFYCPSDKSWYLFYNGYKHLCYMFTAGFTTALILFSLIYALVIHPRMNFLNFTDKQTGLFNYHYFLKMLNSKAGCFLVVIADIDNFKKYNYKYGYTRGDKIILCVKDILQEYVTASKGTVFRYRNGDEFAIILEHNEANVQSALGLLSDINKTVSNISPTEGFTISFGITVKDNALRSNQVIERLESALFVAKSLKNSAYCINSDWEGWVLKPQN